MSRCCPRLQQERDSGRHPTLTGWLRLAPPRGAASSLGGRAATLRARLALAPGLECLPLHRESCKTLALMSRC